MTTADFTAQFQRLFSTDGFRRTFSKKCYTVEVWHDHEGNRLLKTLDGKVKATLDLPRNWTDRERHDGRKWIVACVRPAMGLHLTPVVEVDFFDKKMGQKMTKAF